MSKSPKTYEVEFIPKAPAEVTEKDPWFKAVCRNRDEAIQLEASFHKAGWVARIAVLTVVRDLLA